VVEVCSFISRYPFNIRRWSTAHLHPGRAKQNGRPSRARRAVGLHIKSDLSVDTVIRKNVVVAIVTRMKAYFKQ